jgi:hypothetical protein
MKQIEEPDGSSHVSFLRNSTPRRGPDAGNPRIYQSFLSIFIIRVWTYRFKPVSTKRLFLTGISRQEGIVPSPFTGEFPPGAVHSRTENRNHGTILAALSATKDGFCQFLLISSPIFPDTGD